MLTTGHAASRGLLIYNDTRFPENYRGLILCPDAGRQSSAPTRWRPKGRRSQVAAAVRLPQEQRPAVPARPGGPRAGRRHLRWSDRPGDVNHGRIYRLTWAGTKDQPALPPRGMDSWAKIAKLGDDDLVKALASDDGSDRDHARLELARRGEKNRPRPPQTPQGRRSAGRGRASRRSAPSNRCGTATCRRRSLSVLEHDSSADLRRLAADAVGLNAAKGDDDVHAVLLRALNDAAPEVRRSVALAMSHVAADGAPDNLVNTWAFDDGRDAYLRDGSGARHREPGGAGHRAADRPRRVRREKGYGQGGAGVHDDADAAGRRRHSARAGKPAPERRAAGRPDPLLRELPARPARCRWRRWWTT